MSAAMGWYPDPGGQPGMFRYWDGQTWSAALSATPTAPPPTNPRPLPRSAGTGVPRRTSHRTGPWLGLLALVVAVVVLIVLGVRFLGGALGGGGLPGGDPSTQVCPTQASATPLPQPGDGRVHGGSLSYPTLGAPWSAPEPEYRVAFGEDVLIQSVAVETGGARDWLAAVLVGQLASGDGFYEPQAGAEIVVNCVSGTFYGDAEVTRDDRRNEAMTVDGKPAWVIESDLHFDIPTIRAKSERLIVVIVDTGDGTAGLFYASVPETSPPQLLPAARRALAQLTVD